MLLIALALTALLFGCALVIALAVFALPFFVGFAATINTYRATGDVLAALAVGVLAGVLVLALGHIASATERGPLVRAMAVGAFAIAAAIAGYHVAVGLTQIVSLSPILRRILGVIGAVSFGAAAWRRMTTLARPRRNCRASE